MFSLILFSRLARLVKSALPDGCLRVWDIEDRFCLSFRCMSRALRTEDCVRESPLFEVPLLAYWSLFFLSTN